MRVKASVLFLFVPVLLIATACKKDRNSDVEEPGVVKIAPDNFVFSTTKDLLLSLRLLTNNGEPIKGALVTVTGADNPNDIYLRAISDNKGYVNTVISVPAYLDTLDVSPNYVGLLNRVKVYAGGKTALNVTIGGADGASGDIIPESTPVAKTGSNGATMLGGFGVDYVYPSPYTGSAEAIVNTTQYPFALGRPKYLESTPDVISSSLLSYVNASLPEGKALSVTHPQYLSSAAVPNINVQETGDVWITFVSEGASYRNTLAYYTYPTGSVPSTATAGTYYGGIDKVTMVFPNASALSSSGGLKSGDKVKLGRFTKGTTIAFVLIQDAWNGNGIVTSNTKFYTDQKFNPETTTSLKKHSVLLYDDIHSLFVMGFEDVNRQSNSDNDFNDLVVYASANPSTAISSDGVSAIDKGNDDDGDGVFNDIDEFPNDPNKAYITYYPSASGWSTLAFEDSWPKTADYDLNDLVVNYRYTCISNAANAVVEMRGEFQPVAVGADYKNGLGIELPFTYDKIASVTGQNLQVGSYVLRNANGTEAGQRNAVVFPFDNTDNLIKNPDNSTLVNTVPGKAWIAPLTATVNIVFSSPVSFTLSATAPFNPFLVTNQRRGYEVHLPGKKPTDKADMSLFGSNDDNSSVSSNRYYLNGQNWPWALSFPDKFDYPTEKTNISEAYPHFLDWAQSGGGLFPDWFSSSLLSFRVSSKIYNK